MECSLVVREPKRGRPVGGQDSRMSRQIHVVHAVTRMVHGGVESWLMNVWRHVDRDRFRFTFCTLNYEPGVFDTEIVSLGGRIVCCSIRAGYRRFARQFKAALVNYGDRSSMVANVNEKPR